MDYGLLHSTFCVIMNKVDLDIFIQQVKCEGIKMGAMIMSPEVINREVSFCRVYSVEGKEKLEKIFLENRISYFIEWQDKSWITRLFSDSKSKEKSVFTIRINEADVEKATALVQGIDSVRLRKKEAKEKN